MNAKSKADKGLPESMVGCWNIVYENREYEREVYDDPTTAKVAGGFLNQPNITVIENWGCGYGGFKEYVREDQQYVGIDGSNSRFADFVVDLESYVSSVDAVHMRHVIEHNPNWESVLKNALMSFKKRMVLTLYTPFQDETKVIDIDEDWLGTGKNIPVFGFKYRDIERCLEGKEWFSIQNIKTETDYKIEHMFFIQHSPGNIKEP